jgi:hypothetical protein
LQKPIFTATRFHTKQLLHKPAFTQIIFYTTQLLHKPRFKQTDLLHQPALLGPGSQRLEGRRNYKSSSYWKSPMTMETP